MTIPVSFVVTIDAALILLKMVLLQNLWFSLTTSQIDNLIEIKWWIGMKIELKNREQFYDVEKFIDMNKIT